MTVDSRMPEIKANLKQDAQELLQESARLLTGFFSRGLCTVRMAAQRWNVFASGISEAAKNLVKPDFVCWTEARDDVAQVEPLVAVLESTDAQMKIGERLSLFKADALVETLDRQHQKEGVEPTKARLMIDYIMEEQRDKYYVDVTMGDGGGSLLEQISSHIESYRLDPERFGKLLEGVSSEARAAHLNGIREDMDRTATQVLRYFQRHCDIGRLERHFEACAETMPIQEKIRFKGAAMDQIYNLRLEANRKLYRTITVRRPQAKPQERPSVKLTLQQLKHTTGRATPARQERGTADVCK